LVVPVLFVDVAPCITGHLPSPPISFIYSPHIAVAAFTYQFVVEHFATKCNIRDC